MTGVQTCALPIYKSLTKGQYDTLVKIETHYTPEVIAAASQWKANYTEEMRDNWKAVVEYYETTPYYGNVVKKTKENPEYIPSEAEYKSVVENKYASRYLANRKIAPKHKIGEMVILKQWGSYRLATVTSIHTKLSNWSKGSRIYDVLIVGDASPISVYEKDLLFYRNSMSDKIMLKTEELPF